MTVKRPKKDPTQKVDTDTRETVIIPCIPDKGMTGKRELMATVVFVDDDFRRMPRADMAKLERIIASGKYGVHKISFKEKQVNVEIKKQGDKILVKLSRVM